MKVKSLSLVLLFATPQTVAYQAPPSMGFSRQEYWTGLPLPSQDIVSELGIYLMKKWVTKQYLYHEPISVKMYIFNERHYESLNDGLKDSIFFLSSVYSNFL